MRAAGDEEEGCHQTHQPDGDVDEKEQTPPADGEQEATDRGAQGQSEGLGRPLDSERPAQPAAGHGQGDDGHAVGLQHGGTDGLDGAEGVQSQKAGSGGTEHRADDEDDEAVEVEELPTHHVGKPPHGRHRGHQHQEVGQAHPADRGHPGVEGPLKGRKGQRDDAGVQLAHERTHAHGGHGQEVTPGKPPDRLGAPGLDGQLVPSGGPFVVDNRRTHLEPSVLTLHLKVQ